MAKMEYNVDMKKGEQSNYNFVVKVTAEQKKACHEAVIKEYQKDAVQPGFRKGHVPLAMVEKLANPATIFMATMEDIVNEAIQQIVTAQPDIRWIGQIYNLDTSEFKDMTEEGSVSFSLDVFPEIQQKNDTWKKQKVAPYTTEVNEDDITTAIDQLRSSSATFEDVEKVSKTSLMRLKIAFLDKKWEAIGNGKNQYLGQEELSEHPSIQKDFLNKTKGDVVILEYKKASVISLLQYSGEEEVAKVSCEIVDIKQKVLAELNQEFIDKTFQKEENITSVEILKEKVKETLEANKQENSLYEWVDNYLTAIDSSFDLKVPQTLIEEEVKNRLHHLSHQLGGEKGLDAYLERMGKQEADKYIDTIRTAAISSMHKYFILKYVADELKLDIDREKAQANGEVEKKLYEKLVK